jgi:hypothetical protein
LQFEYTNPQSEIEEAFGGFYSVNIFGTIEPGDDVKFEDFLRQAGPPPRTCVYINSVGGDVEAAIGIGRLVRDAWFATSIGQYLIDHEKPSEFIKPRKLIPGICASAATLIFLGGRLRYFSDGAKFGVHQFSFRDPSPAHIGKSQVLSAKIAKYITDMGVSPEFLELSSSVIDSDIRFVDEKELMSLRIITGGMTDVTWSMESLPGIIYVRGVRDSMFGHHKVMLGHGKDAGFLFFAVVEALGRHRELTEFKLVEIVINDEDTRIDISSRCDRSINGIDVVILCELTDDEAKLISKSDSFGVQIRASNEAEIFLGVSAMSTKGGQEKLDTLYNMFTTAP